MKQTYKRTYKQAVQKMAGSAWFAKVGPHVVPRVDRTLHRLSGGKYLMSQGMLPSLVLTNTGAKSGLTRQTPLATLPLGDDTFLVVGSNFGREKHPAWSANLLANPDASVSFRGRDVRVRAHLLTPEEKAEVWPRLLKIWPVYDAYVERSGRDLRVFRLDPLP